MSASSASVAQLLMVRRLRRLAIVGAGFALAVICGPLIGLLGSRGEVAVLAILLFIPLPALFWRFPSTAALVPFAVALTVEQFGTGLADRLTDRLQLFRTLNTSVHLSGVLVSPVEIVLGMALLTLLIRAVVRRDVCRLRSPVARSLAALLLVLLLAAARGRLAGGDLQIIVNELRPFLYVVVLYGIASQAIRTREQLRALLWVDVLATGFKGLQGTYRTIVLSGTPVDAIFEHDEAVFFSLFILVTVGLWLFGMRGRLRMAATALLPFVVIAGLANQRRAAWLVLGVGVVLLLVTSWVSSRERRRRATIFALLFGVTSAVYVPLFWNGTGALAEPARAIRSGFAPDARDDSSDLYREVETYDLGLDIRASTPLGEGFGLPIAHPVALPYDASRGDPLINFVPHNTILYLWLRTGIAGMLTFWLLIGAATVLACRLVRNSDRWICLVGAFGLWTIAAYVVEGWIDLGLGQYRTAVVVGCALGCLGAARRITADQDASGEEAHSARATQDLRPSSGG